MSNHEKEIAELGERLSEIVTELGAMQARLRMMAHRTATPDRPALVSLTNAAPMIGVSVATVYRMAAAGQIPVVMAGSRRKIARAWLDAYSAGEVTLLNTNSEVA